MFQVETFIEKPVIKTAEKLIKEKRYFWNSEIIYANSIQLVPIFTRCKLTCGS
ncbi:sugar phosphate nucleotidyltransferase [Peribacillus simplex]|uniref:sugar phosphate nucleotidyltransferase n=1 Tax=Peribacillus simplex TaxID=1478 RepID=UPI00366C2155